MKKELVLGLSAFFFMSLSTVALSRAVEKQPSPAPILTLHSYEADVTGDSRPDRIFLRGTPYEEGGQYLKNIWADILTSQNKKIRLHYEAGYKPVIELKDFNHDGIKDILESSNTGGSGGIYSYNLATFKDQRRTELPLPQPLNIEGRFQNNLQAVIHIPGVKDSIKLDLKKRKADYERLSIYQKNGMLNEQTELMIDPVSVLKPVRISGKKGYGLKAYRQVSGAYHADRLGVVKTIWYWENGKWQLLNTKWVKE